MGWLMVMIKHVKIIFYCTFIILLCLKYAVLWLWDNTPQKYTNAVRQMKIRIRSLMQPESMHSSIEAIQREQWRVLA
jgi:hypothetical protein